MRQNNNKEQRGFDKLMLLLTPQGQFEKPVLSCRNILCVVNAIFDNHEPWMMEQDIHEVGDNNDYKSKISKYKLLVEKLNETQSNALQFCASSDIRKLIENIPENQQSKLDSAERLMVTRGTKSDEFIAAFKGNSICFDRTTSQKLHQLFKPTFYKTGIKMATDQITVESLYRKKEKMNERQIEAKQGYAEKLTSSFSLKDSNAAARCELQKVQFLNSSKKVSNVTSGQRSPDKQKLIVIKDKDSLKKFMLNLKIDNTHLDNYSRQKP